MEEMKGRKGCLTPSFEGVKDFVVGNGTENLLDAAKRTDCTATDGKLFFLGTFLCEAVQ
jgi:hypothetical protein